MKTKLQHGRVDAEQCDHTSVGVLIYNEQHELLLIERGTFDYSVGLPAGHVDQQPSFEDAAASEVLEELGLTVETLRLVAEGRRDNPCRRGGDWHYWKVYEAVTSGSIKLNQREVKAVQWCSAGRLVELNLLCPSRLSENREHVWLDWIYKLQVQAEV